MAIITRWGHSNGGIRIPQAILTAAGLRVGDELGCRLLDSGAILLTPYKAKVIVNQEQLLVKDKPTVEKW